MPPKRRTQSSVKTTSSKKRKVTSTSTPSTTKTSTRTGATPPTSSLPQAVSDVQQIQRIAVAVIRAFKDQTSSQASPDTPSESFPSASQHQPDSAPLVQQSVAEAIQQITGVNQAAETSNDESTSKSQFVSVAAPLGSSVSAKNIEQWTNAFLVFVAIYCEKLPSQAPSLMKYMSIVRELVSRSGNWRFYDESFRKLREVDPLPWGRTHSEIWLRAHKVTKPGAQANFRPKQGVSTTPPGLLL